MNINFVKNDETFLYTAIEKGYTKIVELLIEKGADVNFKDKYGWTPLYLAAKEGYAEIVQF